MSSENLNFIVVDDSKLDCFIAEKIIKNTGRVNTCNVFQQASDALAFINDKEADTTKHIVFVDIQMPVMNGFEFVEAFEALPEEKIKNHNIYMLSSSINENDIAKVKGYASVKRFLNKPLTNDTISTVLSEI
ncbi:MAG: response regulator [Flavipsychrobacter sp.]